MDKLSEIQDYQAMLMEAGNCTKGTANKLIALKLDVSVSTVEGYLNKGQAKPIPDKSLQLLKLLKD